MSKFDWDDVGDDVNRIQYISVTLGVFQEDFLSDQEQSLLGGTSHTLEGDTSDSHYIPRGLRAGQGFSSEQIKEVRGLIGFMPMSIIPQGLKIPLEPDQQFGFVLSDLDEGNLTRTDPRIVVARMVDYRTGEFAVVRDETQRYNRHVGETGGNLRLRPEGWQPEWRGRGGSRERR